MLLKFAAIAALFFSATILFAKPETAVLSGTVADISGAAVSGASVNLHQLAGSAFFSATSDASGQFRFDGVSAGEYLLDASAPGLTIDSPKTITLGAGESNSVALTLAVSAVSSEVTVTAADEPQPTDSVSKALDVVSVAAAEQRGLFSVPDALRFVPGLRVSTRGGPGAFTTIQARGLFVEGTAILIDGYPFRDPTSIQNEASAYIGDLLLVDSSRIEVLRGSGSSLYGTNAMGAAINIITDPGGGPVHGDLDLQGGGLGLFRGLAHIAGGAWKNRLDYSAGFSHLNVTEGVDGAQSARDWSAQGTLGYMLTPNIRIAADAFANTGYLQLNVTPAPEYVTIPASGIIPAIPLNPAQIQLADANLPFDPGNTTFIPSLGDPDSGEYSHFIQSLFRLEHQVNSRLSYRIGYAIFDADRLTTDGPAGPGYQSPFNSALRYGGRIDTVRAQADYLLGTHQILTSGYEFEREGYRTVSNDDNLELSLRNYFKTVASQRSNAAYFQDQIHFFAGRLQVLLSGRYTEANLNQPQFAGGASPYANIPLATPPSAYTGDASLAYFFQSTSTKLRAHTGNSFRLPSLYERFGTNLFDGVLANYGDPHLSPERAISVDAGIDQYLFGKHLKVSGSYFYAHLQQIVGFLDFPPGYVDPYGRSGGYYNTGGGISRGAEVSGDFRPSRRTSIFASDTYTNAKDRIPEYYTGTPVSPLQTARILPNSVSVAATQQIGRHVDLGLDFQAGSDYLYPLYGYAYQFPGPRQLGLDAGYSVPLNDRVSVRFYTRISNALGQNFYEDGFHTPGRWAVAGMHFSF